MGVGFLAPAITTLAEKDSPLRTSRSMGYRFLPRQAARAFDGLDIDTLLAAHPEGETGAAQVVIEEKDPVSGKYVQIAAFAALTASVLGATPSTATYVYTLCAGASETIAAANHEVQALPAPRTWRGRVVHSAGGSWTYSVGAVTLR